MNHLGHNGFIGWRIDCKNEAERRYYIYSDFYAIDRSEKNYEYMIFWFIAASFGIETARKECN